MIIDLEIEATVRAFQQAIPGLDPETFLGKRGQLPFLNRYETGAIGTWAFLRVIEENGLDPGATLFIDDTLQHIEGAARLGIRTHHLKPGESLENILDLYSL